MHSNCGYVKKLYKDQVIDRPDAQMIDFVRELGIALPCTPNTGVTG
ncbi:MAG: hypothetical protein JWQ81_2421 [Amycolatopsis sp.]|nr:hypothetical protein [Amycolatopsis sp.]